MVQKERKGAAERTSFVLKADVVRAGDVLLTRGRGLGSAAIAALSGGPGLASAAIAVMMRGLFSHAAIWLPRVTGTAALTGIFGLELFESEDSGVGETSLTKAYFTTRHGMQELGMLISDAAAVALFRHPMIEKLEPRLLEDAANRLREKEQYLGYSELDRLAQAANRMPLLKPYITSFLRSQDNRDVTLVPGSFCSELVAKYFDELGLALFEPRRAPETVAPNDLRDSLLKEVKGAFLDTSGLQKVEHLLQNSWPGRKDFLPAMVRFKSRSIQVSRQVQILEETFSQSRSETLAAQSAMLSLQVPEAVKKAEDAERYDDLVMAQRLSITAQSYLLALALCHEIMKRRSQPAFASSKVWPNAEARLVHALSKMSSQIDREFTRRSALVDIRFARRLCRAEMSEERSIKLLQIRRILIENWMRKYETDKQWHKIFVKVEETFYEDEKVNAIIEDVMRSAFNLAHHGAEH
jgi:hypothetical protein